MLVCFLIASKYSKLAEENGSTGGALSHGMSIVALFKLELNHNQGANIVIA